jgi:hypothetical protein
VRNIFRTALAKIISCIAVLEPEREISHFKIQKLVYFIYNNKELQCILQYLFIRRER